MLAVLIGVCAFGPVIGPPLPMCRPPYQDLWQDGSRQPQSGWVRIFNGKNLDGWTPKIKGYPFGSNYERTFRVVEGCIRVDYSGYDKFDTRFGHLFYRSPYSFYRLRLEYRFLGNQLPDGPGWAYRNSGIMIHCQDPKSMRLDQDFPVSIEVQLLGGNGAEPRTTGNLCTPGTNVVVNGQLETRHCTDSTSKTFHGDRWVRAEVRVNGSGKIEHFIEGQRVLGYEKPQLDPNDPDGKALAANRTSLLLTGGYISLQSESHPVEFRNVEIMSLDK